MATVSKEEKKSTKMKIRALMTFDVRLYTKLIIITEPMELMVINSVIVKGCSIIVCAIT